MHSDSVPELGSQAEVQGQGLQQPLTLGKAQEEGKPKVGGGRALSLCPRETVAQEPALGSTGQKGGGSNPGCSTTMLADPEVLLSPS